MLYSISVCFGLISNINHQVEGDTLTIDFSAFGTDHSLKLKKNNFLSQDFKAYHHRLNQVKEVPYDDCYYVSDNAAFRACNGLAGSFYSSDLNTTIQVEHHHGSFFNITKKLATNNWCSGIGNATNVTDSPIEIEGILFKRAAPAAVVEILALGDYTLVKKYGNKTVQFILDSVNTASSIYVAAGLTQITLTLSLNAVITFNAPIISDYGEDAILEEISSFIFDLALYKAYFPNPKFDYLRQLDHFTFITATAMIPVVNITHDYDSIVGSAQFNTMCTVRSVSVVSESSISGSGPMGNALAHEIAHSLGVLHDGDNSIHGNNCPNTGNLMSPVIQFPTFNTFSSCSKVYLQSSLLLQYIGSGCLFNPSGSSQIDPALLCGNGIVDFGAGEECDAGAETNCCDTSCKLKNGATCDDSNGSCCFNCTLLSNLRTCKSQTDPYLVACDSSPVSYCDGISPYCPIDTNSPDGSICTVDNNQGFCNNGYCFTKSKVCDTYNSAFYTFNCDPNNDCIIKCGIRSGGCGFTEYAMSDGSKCGAAFDGVCSNAQCVFASPVSMTPIVNTQPLSLLVRKSAPPNNLLFTIPRIATTTLLPTEIAGASNAVAPLSATGAILIVIAAVLVLILTIFAIYKFYAKKGFIDSIELQAITSHDQLKVLSARTLKEDDD